MLSQVLCLSVMLFAIVYGESLFFNEEKDITEEPIKTLVDIEKEIIEIFNTSMENCHEELNMLRNFLNRVKAEHNNMTESAEEYLANPINAYSLIKRMTLDWIDLKSSLSSLKGIQYLKNQMGKLRETVQLPNSDDLKVAAKDVLNLQMKHNLQVTDLIKGIINGNDYGDLLEWDDSFEIGKVAFENGQLKVAKEWFSSVLELLKSTQPPVNEAVQKDIEIQLMEYAALIDYESGDSESALKHLDAILAEYPEHPAKSTKTYILLNENSDFIST